MTSETNDRNTSILGMWIFLATELLLFSTLLLSLFLYRHLHPEAFAEGSRHLSRFLGSLNTVILLTSSFSMAKAVHASRDPSKNRTVGLSLMITALLGGVFLSTLSRRLDACFPLVSRFRKRSLFSTLLLSLFF